MTSAQEYQVSDYHPFVAADKLVRSVKLEGANIHFHFLQNADIP